MPITAIPQKGDQFSLKGELMPSWDHEVKKKYPSFGFHCDFVTRHRNPQSVNRSFCQISDEDLIVSTCINFSKDYRRFSDHMRAVRVNRVRGVFTRELNGTRYEADHMYVILRHRCIVPVNERPFPTKHTKVGPVWYIYGVIACADEQYDELAAKRLVMSAGEESNPIKEAVA